MKRVLLLRAREDAERTGATLRDRGYAPVMSPVLEIVATHAPAPEGRFGAALATSFNGVELADFSFSLPLHTVGARAMEAGVLRGWRRGVSGPSALALAETLVARGDAPQDFLYLAGRDRKDALVGRLHAAGHEVTVVETYVARAAATLSDEAKDALRAGDVFAALHFSRRSAEIFLELCEAEGLRRDARRLRHLALSADVAAPILEALAIEPMIAETPNEKGLIALLPLAA